jgi:hypothetical protein
MVEEFSEFWGWKATLYNLSNGDPRLEDYYLDMNWERFLNELAFRNDLENLRNSMKK